MTKKIKKITQKVNEVFETSFRPWQLLLVLIALAGLLGISMYILYKTGTPNV